MTAYANRPPDIVLTPQQAQRVTPLVSDVVSSLGRRLSYQHFQLTGNHEAAAAAHRREVEENRDTSRFLTDDRPAGGTAPPRPADDGTALVRTAKDGGPPPGVLGRDQATTLNSVGQANVTTADLQQGAVLAPGQQPSNQPFGLPGGPTVGVAGVTSGVGAGYGGMGMGGAMGAHGPGRSGNGPSTGILGRAEPEVWGALPDTPEPDDRKGGNTLATGGEARPRRGLRAARDGGGGGPPSGVLGRP
ncbi:hypothetical protein ABT160_10230 [Streptomyces sp. NPDC001941]|uniref:hypothetical protein n=1 Tax=Streptomyces sp. NPDC001941 TaxID=3154659 RepID=UPI00331C2517